MKLPLSEAVHGWKAKIRVGRTASENCAWSVLEASSNSDQIVKLSVLVRINVPGPDCV